MSIKENLPININFNNYDLLIGFSIQFFIMNFINILFGYYVLLPLMNIKYKNTFSNSLSVVSKLDFFNLKTNKDNKKNDKELENNNNKYLKVTLTFFFKIALILIILNICVLIINPYKYLIAIKDQISLKTFSKVLIGTIFILLIQLFYFNNFTFSYYLNLILKYVL